ncbi:MAG: RHS repeat protein [Halanaerobiales bacterium]|nr:RHS repeat protein [Halanaerobiales bacterium]
MGKQYNILGRVTKVIYPADANIEATFEEVIYDDENNLVEIYDGERRNLVKQYFDGLGRTTKIEKYFDLAGTELDSEISFTYNWQNQVKSSFDENGKEINYEYDIFGRQTNVSTNEEGIETVLSTIQYIDQEKKTIAKNQNNIKQTTITDRKGQVVQQLLENQGEELNYFNEYDGFGNVVKTTDAKGQQMGYIYNNVGQLVKVKYSDHLGQISDLAHSLNLTVFNYYDNKGNLKTTIDRNRQTINYKYNEYNQLIQADLPVSEDIDYYYNELGQLIKVKQGTKFEKFYSYDVRGRLTKDKLTVDPSLGTEKEYVTEYDYNKNNAITDIVYPNAAGTLHYDYNTLNQIYHVSWKGSDLVKSVDYTKTGHLEKITYGKDVAVGQFNYDYVNGQYVPNNISYIQRNKQLGVYDYQYDKLGNIIRANNHQYEYDDLNQLTGWKFLQENDRVLLGEKVILEKEMTNQLGLSLDQTFVTSGKIIEFSGVKGQ